MFIDYVDKDKKNPDGLTEEDKLMLALTRVERLSQKLSVMQVRSTRVLQERSSRSIVCSSVPTSVCTEETRNSTFEGIS